MHLERYDYTTIDEFREYEFLSMGPRGGITKIVRFDPMVDESVPYYNLYFGDWDPKQGRADDMSVSNNGDMNKVLATVAVIAQRFVLLNPQSKVFAQGSTAARSRLYQMLINKHIKRKEEGLQVVGYTDENKWSPFKPNVNYHSFILKRA